MRVDGSSEENSGSDLKQNIGFKCKITLFKERENLSQIPHLE